MCPGPQTDQHEGGTPEVYGESWCRQRSWTWPRLKSYNGKVNEIIMISVGRGDISRGRLKILEGREQRRQEDIRNALKMKEQWELEKQQKMKQ